MHYHAWSFAINYDYQTIIAPNGITLGQREFLTDVSIINVVLFKIRVSYIIPFFVNILSIQIDAYEINVRYNCTAFL